MNINRKNYVDFIKSIALFMVFGVHFISLWGGWTGIPLHSNVRIPALMIYFLCDCCVPLFFMSTGMLLSKRSFSIKQHYIKIVPIVLMYLLASVLCGVFKYIVQGENISKLIKGVFTFNTASYSWYVKYYILLFVLIPIINMVLIKLGNGKNLYTVLLCMTILSTVGCYFRYSYRVENNMILLVLFKLLKNIFPILYYMLGYTINENRKILKTIRIEYFLLLAITFLLGESLYYHFVYLGKAIPLVPNGYGTWNVILLSILIVSVLIRYETGSNHSIIQKIIIETSNSTLIAYLVSEILDNLAFKILGAKMPIPLYWILPWMIFVSTVSILIGIGGTRIVRSLKV